MGLQVLDAGNKLSSEEEKVITDRIIRSRCQMLMAFPFFGILSLKLGLEINYNIKTAATDGEKLYYNPNFIKTLPEAQLNWLIVHEVMHPALQHLWRKGDRLDDLWNEACDYAIHDVMHQFKDSTKNIQSKMLEMPPGGLYDKEYTDKSADQIYDILRKKRKQNKNKNNGNGGNGNGNGDGGNTLDDHSLWNNQNTQNAKEIKAAQWEGNLVAAAQAAQGKDAGNVPGFLKRIIGKITKPQKNWRSLLQEFVEPEINDYSFNPPDKRLSELVFSFDDNGMPIEVLLPDFNEEVDVVKKILFWVDTSGSIGEEELTVAYSEIVGAINQFQGKLSGYIGFFDHKAYEPVTFESVDDVLKTKPVGGGGTCFHAPFEYVNEHFKDLDEIAGIIMLTDGYASWPQESIAKGIPTLWLITNEDQVPPWGLHTTITI